MTLKERFLAAETKLGMIIMWGSGTIGAALAVINEGGQWVGFIPEGFVPIEIKTGIGVVLFISAFLGKMTAKK